MMVLSRLSRFRRGRPIETRVREGVSALAFKVARDVASKTLSGVDLSRQVGNLFRGTSYCRTTDEPGLVGVEMELIPVATANYPPQPVGKAALEQALLADPDLAREARVTFEPGGQIELSPPPLANVSQLLTIIDHVLGRLRHCAARREIMLVSTGVNMWHGLEELGLQTDQPRYRAMQAHFDAIGPQGCRMMRQTAALQVCLDFGRGDVADRRWLLANRAGPALTAAFANSAVLEGMPTGLRSTRSAIWQTVDPSRTGFDGQQIGPDPMDAYTAFALRAEAMPLPQDGGEAVPLRLPFADWLAADGDRPDAADLRHHLTTLFPPVRPHGYLEVRYIDAMPAHWLPVPVLLLTALLYDREACEDALAGLSLAARPWQEWWRVAAASGMADGALRSQALMLFALALDAIPRFPPGYFPASATELLMTYRDRYLLAARCPADDQRQFFVACPDDLSRFL